MGKNLITQRRGRGTSTYRAPGHNVVSAKYPRNSMEGIVVDIVHSRTHSAPLVKIENDTGEEFLMIAPEGVKVGDGISVGRGDSIIGNVLRLIDVPEGTAVYNLESKPGDGGKFVRASGVFAKVLSKIGTKVLVKLPSNKDRYFDGACRATIGVISGGGRLEKPFMKAGARYYEMKSKNKLYPRTRGLAMNAVDHPFGGKSSHTKGRPLQSGRDYPPGRMVGKIAPRRTGRRKR